MIRTASVTDLRDKLADTLDVLDKENAVMVVRHSKPAAYLVSPRLFEALMVHVEDLEDIREMQLALEDYQQGQAVEAEEVFQRLGL